MHGAARTWACLLKTVKNMPLEEDKGCALTEPGILLAFSRAEKSWVNIFFTVVGSCGAASGALIIAVAPGLRHKVAYVVSQNTVFQPPPEISIRPALEVDRGMAFLSQRKLARVLTIDFDLARL